jgi:hypothetical protein
MADFSQPVYASYVALCRELKLERTRDAVGKLTFRYGDWVYHPHMIQIWEGPWVGEGEDYIWLPSLSDWLEMLEEIGLEDFRYLRTIPGGRVHIVAGFMTGSPFTGEEFADGDTPEEAAARLWMEVRKKANV